MGAVVLPFHVRVNVPPVGVPVMVTVCTPAVPATPTGPAVPAGAKNARERPAEPPAPTPERIRLGFAMMSPFQGMGRRFMPLSGHGRQPEPRARTG
jgi:hypothetical protein